MMAGACPAGRVVHVAAAPPAAAHATWPDPGTVDVHVGPDGRLWILFMSGVGPGRAAIPLGPGAARDLAERLWLSADRAEGTG